MVQPHANTLGIAAEINLLTPTTARVPKEEALIMSRNVNNVSHSVGPKRSAPNHKF